MFALHRAHILTNNKKNDEEEEEEEKAMQRVVEKFKAFAPVLCESKVHAMNAHRRY